MTVAVVYMALGLVAAFLMGGRAAHGRQATRQEERGSPLRTPRFHPGRYGRLMCSCARAGVCARTREHVNPS